VIKPNSSLPSTGSASASTPVARSPYTPREGIRRVASSDLLGDASELVIEHGGREYRLRITSNGKLILTA